ncbi:MAG: hypothetical protein HY287_07170 [Planctomycetes bacterium]|nr:hypothetical protein [Planctomycetota bacterium]
MGALVRLKQIVVYGLFFSSLCIISPKTVFAQDKAAPPQQDQSANHKTNWRIEPSLKFDTLCLLNTLTGDPYYLDFYRKVYDEFAPKLTPEAKAALADLKTKIKDEGKGIISARLCLLFSAADDTTLDQLLATIKKPDKLRENLSKTPYWDEDDWKNFEAIRDDLKTIFKWLKQIQFEKQWAEKAQPAAAKKAQEMLDHVKAFDVVPLIEQHLGKPLESDTITVYMLTYSQPHGIKITGTRFLTDIAWPFQIVVRNAVHEMMHPPYTLQGDADLKAVLDTLRADKFFMDKVEHHNPSFGYNTLEGFVDEDCVQALDQLITEKLGIALIAKSRWKQSDDGMHVLAVSLYQMMKAENYPSKDKSFRDFLVRMNNEGQFQPGKIEDHFQKMYGL